MSIIHQAAGGIGAFKVGVGQPPLQSTRNHSILQANVIASYLSGGGGAFQEKRGFSILWTELLPLSAGGTLCRTTTVFTCTGAGAAHRRRRREPSKRHGGEGGGVN